MTKNTINAQIVADSIDPRGNRITTFVLTYPRIIHAEMMTHRVFSRNAASSRAIPFNKMVKSVLDDPFIPIAWQKDHKGMQGTEYFTENDLACPGDPDIKDDVPFHLTQVWLKARDEAINLATYANNNGLTKQLCNRLLEPFQWYTCLLTTTEFDNFYELRCPKFINKHENGEDISFSRKDFIKKLQERYPTNWEMELKDFFRIENNTEEEWFSLSNSGAEIHIQTLAEAMWDAKNESLPNQLEAGEWHIPFGNRIDITIKSKIVSQEYNRLIEKYDDPMSNCLPTIDLRDLINPLKVKIATARCARLSYMTFDGEIDYEKDIKLHDQLIGPPFHASPFEHCCRVMSDEEYETFVKGRLDRLGEFIERYEEGYLENLFIPDQIQGWCNNVRGFIQYRYLLENGNS